jgi:hypothetical protein
LNCSSDLRSIPPERKNFILGTNPSKQCNCVVSLHKRPSFAAQSLSHSPHNYFQLVSLLRENRYKSPCFATGRTYGLASHLAWFTDEAQLSSDASHAGLCSPAPWHILPSYACLSEVTLSHLGRHCLFRLNCFRVAQSPRRW